MKDAKKKKSGSSTLNKAATREYRVYLHKRLFEDASKNRAPRAIKELKKFAEKHMGTKDVRIEVPVNEIVSSHGDGNAPARICLSLSRRRNENDNSPHKFYVLVSFARGPAF